MPNSICCWENFLGRPSLNPGRCLAISFPSWVRSTIRSRSKSAKALKIVKINLPVDVFSMIPKFRTLTRTPFSNKYLIVFNASCVLLANLSNFVTTIVSPDRTASNNFLKSGRSLFVPVIFSKKI